jgi:hypothetical protein
MARARPNTYETEPGEPAAAPVVRGRPPAPVDETGNPVPAPVSGAGVPITNSTRLGTAATTNTNATLKTPEQRAADDAAAGYAHADKNGIGADGSHGRIDKTALDELLAKQKLGLDGMTPAEMQAAREQGTATINQQLATNMQQFGDVAAGNGIRGGSAAGLQMQALAGAQAASGQLSRQMILDNVAQKNIAMDRYGTTLNSEMDIQGKNLEKKMSEKLARELAATNYSSQIDSLRSGDMADALTRQGLRISQSNINSLNNPTKPKGSGSSTPAKTAGSGVNGQQNKIICTEAFRQGLISEEQWLVTQRYRKLLTMTEYKGYLTWATPVVARMKRSSRFSRMLAPFIRRMIEGERYALGEIDSLTLGERLVTLFVKAANYSGAAVRSLRLRLHSLVRAPA